MKINPIKTNPTHRIKYLINNKRTRLIDAIFRRIETKYMTPNKSKKETIAREKMYFKGLDIKVPMLSFGSKSFSVSSK